MSMANNDFFIQPDPEVEEAKKSVQDMLDKIKIKQKNTKRLEKEKHQKRIQRIGEIADETGIINLDDNVIKGAFLEIASKIEDITQLVNWKKTGEIKNEVE